MLVRMILEKMKKSLRIIMIQEFKAFLMKGNVMDLAVGIIIGAAFGKIVSSAVEDVVMPLIGTLMGGLDFSGLAVKVGSATLKYGKFLQTCLDFLIIAWAIFLIVNGQIFGGVALIFIGVFVIGLTDNLLRPILVGRDTGIPDWIILITTLGGISFLGSSGIVLGPLVAGLFLASWSILQEQRDEDARATEDEVEPITVDASGRAAPAAE